MSSFIPIENLQPGPWLDAVTWNEQGLVPVIAQEAGSKDMLDAQALNVHFPRGADPAEGPGSKF